MMTPEDLTKLTDPNWVANVLEQIALEEEMMGYDPMESSRRSAAGGEDGEEKGREEWEGKGRRLEVLTVPWE
jgi:hypothetical protein